MGVKQHVIDIFKYQYYYLSFAGNKDQGHLKKKKKQFSYTKM